MSVAPLPIFPIAFKAEAILTLLVSAIGKSNKCHILSYVPSVHLVKHVPCPFTSDPAKQKLLGKCEVHDPAIYMVKIDVK